jgi:hypothetical protein
MSFFNNVWNVTTSKVSDFLTNPDFTEKEIKDRKAERIKYQELYDKAMNPIGRKPTRAEFDVAVKIRNKLDDLKLTYEELPYNDAYVQKLKDLHALETGTKFTGNEKKLVNQSFNLFNEMEQNIGGTLFDLANDNMFYKNYTPEQLEKLSSVFETYVDTDWTKDGSRPLAIQAKNQLVNTATDPMTYATGFAGAIAKQPIKFVLRKKISDSIATKLSMATASAGFGASADLSNQMVQQDLGMRDEISGKQVAAVAAVSSVVPSIFEGGSKLTKKMLKPLIGREVPIDTNTIAGDTIRYVTHPINSFLKNRTTGQRATVMNIQDEAAELLEANSALIDDAATNLTRQVDDLLNVTNQNLSDGFKNMRYNEIPNKEVDNIINKLETNIFTKPDEKITALHKAIKEKNFGEDTISNQIEGLKSIRNRLFDLAESARNDKGGATDTSRAYMNRYGELKELARNYVVKEDKAKFEVLFKANNDLYKILYDTDFGKRINKIISTREIVDKDAHSRYILKEVTTGKTAFADLKRLEKAIKNIDDITLRAGGGKNNTYDEVLQTIREGLGGLVLDDANYKGMNKLLDSKSGFKLLEEIYPNDKQFWQGLEQLKDEVLKKQPKYKTSSVITTMAFARLGAEGGQKVGGKWGQALGAIAAVMQVDQWKNLVYTPKFRTVMAETMANNGRLSTVTSRKLKGWFGFTDEDTRIFQDSMSNLMAVSPLIKDPETVKEAKGLVK